VPIALSTRERLALSAIMNKAGWGGSPAILLAQAALYETLALASFKGMTSGSLAAASNIDRQTYELTAEMLEVLVGALSASGLTMEIGMLCAGVLRRLDPVATVADVAGADAAPPRPKKRGG
jgi:hypothetical protein